MQLSGSVCLAFTKVLSGFLAPKQSKQDNNKNPNNKTELC